ncbi:MAG: YjhG/YagF family D-xylonate dehydratase, partial [bacterium]|nr:YjhG/YagF family D-xylonate dehydratase [bacterium]
MTSPPWVGTGLPSVLVPGGVTLLPIKGEDAGMSQSLGARYAHGEVTLDHVADAGCHICGSPGGGCQFLGTAATSQVVGEALGMTLTHSALSPSGAPIWTDMARRAARAVLALHSRNLTIRDILSEDSIHNALVTHAAFGGSTNLIMHLTAVAHAAGLRRPTVDDWTRVNRQIPRIVDVIPSGPVGHATVHVFLAGGVPEVMLHLRRAGLLRLNALTASGETLGTMLDWWEGSERRAKLRQKLRDLDDIDPDNVIMNPDTARERGLTSTVCFPRGNLTPEGSVIKATAIDPSVVDADGVYRNTGPARVFLTEKDAIAALKSTGPNRIKEGDILVLICRGPMGSGMEEAFQLTIALRHLSFGKYIALLTDARFSGVSTGACIGHVSPEALAGGPSGKVWGGDTIEILIDRNRLEGSVNLVGAEGRTFSPEEGARVP